MKAFRIGVLLALLGLMAVAPARAVQFSRVTLTTSPTLIWTAPAFATGSVLVRNPSASVSIYIGDSTVTTSTGFEVAAGAAVGINLYNSDTLYGTVAASTQVVHYIQGASVR